MVVRRKDPDSVVDYQIDWNLWLAGEQLQSVSWIVPDGLILFGSVTQGGLATARIGGGTTGRRYVVTCRATSSSGRMQDQSIMIICEEM